MALFNGAMLLIGAGNMGGAMLEGWLAAGADPAHFTISDPGLKVAPAGVALMAAPPSGSVPDWLLLAIKPQMLGAVAPTIAHLAGPQTRVLSILAGVDLAVLRRLFTHAKAVVRVMPNLAAALGKSPVALVGEAGLASDDRAAISQMMAALGSAEWLAEEAQLDLVTALAGSGPGFVYRFIDALASGAAALGMDADQAQRLAVQMVGGAGALAALSPHSPAELARRVASPGGVTQVGLDLLDEGDALQSLITRTLAGARDRSAAMAAQVRAQISSD